MSPDKCFRGNYLRRIFAFGTAVLFITSATHVWAQEALLSQETTLGGVDRNSVWKLKSLSYAYDPWNYQCAERVVGRCFFTPQVRLIAPGFYGYVPDRRDSENKTISSIRQALTESMEAVAGGMYARANLYPVRAESRNHAVKTSPANDRWRFEVRSGDETPADRMTGNTSERAELQLNAYMSYRAPVYSRFRMLVEPGSPISSSWAVLGQIHHTRDSCDLDPASPPFAQVLYPDGFTIKTRASREPQNINRRDGNNRLLRNSSEIDHLQGRHMPLKRGVWYAFAYVYRHSDYVRGVPGFLTAQVVENSPPGSPEPDWNAVAPLVRYEGDLGYNDSNGEYFSFGIYRSPAPETLAVQYADMFLGYQQAAPVRAADGSKPCGQQPD